MRRREFIALLGSAAVWPHAALGQTIQGMRRLGVLTNTLESDPEWRPELTAFLEQLTKSGWNEGSNIRIDYRFGAGDDGRMLAAAAELVGLKPDLVLARSMPAVRALLSESRTIPIVFISVSDPVGDKLAASMARPGGVVTGFTNFEASMGGKWLELLKEVAPRVRHVAALFNPEVALVGGTFFSAAIEAAAPSFNVTVDIVPVRDAAGIERAFANLASVPDGGLLGMPDPFISAHRALMIELAARHRLPAVHAFRNVAAEGGLMSCGVDLVNLYRQSAAYIDRILRGENPADLPIQAPTKFELVINLKAAKALGLTVPPTLLARADEVIE
jgi:putative ABC transport system substrate-binding protein